MAEQSDDIARLAPYYADDTVTMFPGRCEDVLPTLEPVDHIITDPPYSEHVHGNARSSRMQSANDRGGKYGSDSRRNVDLGFDHLTPELREVCATEFARPDGSTLKFGWTPICVAFRGVGTEPAERLAAADRFGAVLYGRRAA